MPVCARVSMCGCMCEPSQCHSQLVAWRGCRLLAHQLHLVRTSHHLQIDEAMSIISHQITKGKM